MKQMHLSEFKKKQLSIFCEVGFPTAKFFLKAWASEPLTALLREVNVPLVLPSPDPDISLVSILREENKPGIIVGQCSANNITVIGSTLNP